MIRSSCVRAPWSLDSLSFLSNTERRLDASKKVVLVERLDQVTNNPVSQRALSHAVVRVSRNQNGRYGFPQSYQVAMQLEARHSGHLHVRNQAGCAGNLARAQELLSRPEGLGGIAQ